MGTFLIIMGAMFVGVLVFTIGIGFGQALERDKAKDRKEEAELHDEMTMHKVYRAFMDNGLTQQQAVDTVSAMQNVGILFREQERQPMPVDPFLTGNF